MLQVGRLRQACRSALADLEIGAYREGTVAFLKMVLE